jgi:hypothetical protein
MDKEAAVGSARSFGAHVGAATKKFLNTSGAAKTAGGKNLPASLFRTNDIHTFKQATQLGHPVRPSFINYNYNKK